MKDIVVTDKQKEVSTHDGHADGGALEQFQRESQELYKQYPPAKFYTQESLVAESKQLFANGQLLPERFVLKMEPTRNVLLQIDAVVQSVRNALQSAYPGREPPPTNYYAITESKGGTQYAYVGIVGGANVFGNTNIVGGAKFYAPETSKKDYFDTYQEQRRACLGLPQNSSDKDVDDVLDVLYRKTEAVSYGLPEWSTQKEIDARIQFIYNNDQQVSDAMWAEAIQQREVARQTYLGPYQECIGHFWQSNAD